MLEQIKELRARTFMGLNDCKQALKEANGNFDSAIAILQKKGLKKIDDIIDPLEGEVKANTNGLIVEINCQTDFGARSEIFQNLLTTILTNYQTGLDIKEEFSEELINASKVLGEKIVVKRFQEPKTTSSKYYHYNHNGKIAVVLECTQNSNEKFDALAEQICMHIAAMKPNYLNAGSVPSDLIDKKKEEYLLEVKNKPENIQSKIVEGKILKMYSDITLMGQESIFDPKKPIAQHVKEIPEIYILGFVRFERGER